MEYRRAGLEVGTNVEYNITYKIPKGTNNLVEIDLEVVPVDPDSPHDFGINLPPGSRSSQTENGYEIELDFNQTEEGWLEIKNTAGDNPRSSIKLDIPHPKIFEISRTIYEGHGFFGQESWLKEHFSNDREGYHLISFAGQAEKILTFREYIEVLSFLADQHPRVANVLAENSLGYFTNRVLKPSEPQSVTSFTDLKFKIDLYNEQDFLSNVDINEILKECLEEVYRRQRNSGFQFVEGIISRILPESPTDVAQLTRDVLTIYVACLLDGEQEDQALDLLSSWSTESHDIDGEYASTIREYENKFFEKKKLETNHVGEYLFYVGFNRIGIDSQSGTLPLFEVGYQHMASDNELVKVSKFWAYMRLGKRNMDSNGGSAQDDFNEALSLLDSLEDTEYPIDEWRRNALSGKYRAIVSSYETDSDAESAIEYLNQFVDDDLSELESDSELVEQVEALKYELISKENIRNSAVDLARDNLKKALESYARTDLNKARDRVFARQQLLEGFLDEIKREFESASDRYQVASQIHENSLDNQSIANRYSDLAKINQSKSYLLEGNIKLSQQELEKVSGEVADTKLHRDELRNVITVFADYIDGRVSDTLHSGTEIKTTQVNDLIRVEYNINIAQFVIYASQYLRQYGVGTEILDSIINITLSDALTPNTIHQELDISEAPRSEEGELLLSISMDEVWQSKLPTHIHYQIEKLKIEEITAASDFSGLTNILTTTLELLLVVIAEYYSKKSYGSIVDQISPLDETALGDLITFIRDLPGDELPIVEELDEAFSENILPDREMSEIRNAGHHGADIRHSESQYEQVRDKIVDVFRKISPYCPIIVEIEDKNSFGHYLCVVHWGGIKTRIWLQTDAELKDSELYYIPPKGLQNKHHVHVDSDSIYLCEAQRARSAREVNPVSMDKGTEQ